MNQKKKKKKKTQQFLRPGETQELNYLNRKVSETIKIMETTVTDAAHEE